MLCDIWLGDIFFQVTAPEDGYIKQRKFKAGDLISNADTLAYFIASKSVTISASAARRPGDLIKAQLSKAQ